jgi:glycosyltransferase involved in cell wall biosynthesis
MSKISVIVPVYKVEKYLHKCLDSILSQTFDDFNLILVDDGSPDSCGAICEQYAFKDGRVLVIHQANGGLSAARNAGIDYVLDRCSSKYITFIDSDDWVSPYYLEELMQGMNLSGTISCVSYACVANTGRKYIRYKKDCWKMMDTQSYWCHPDPLKVVAWGKLYPTSYFKDVRFPVGRIHEDVYTTHKLLFQADRVAIKFMPYYFYRFRYDSICHDNWSESRLDEIYGLIDQCEFLRSRNFNDAYMSARAGLLGALSEIIQRRDLISEENIKMFSDVLFLELQRGPVPFWENRAYYRNVMKDGFFLQWLVAMLKDFYTHGSRSWLIMEFLPTLREMKFSFHCNRQKTDDLRLL